MLSSFITDSKGLFWQKKNLLLLSLLHVGINRKALYNQGEAIRRPLYIQRRLFCLLRQGYHFRFWLIGASWPDGLHTGYMCPWHTLPPQSSKPEQGDMSAAVRREWCGVKEKTQCGVGSTTKGRQWECCKCCGPGLELWLTFSVTFIGLTDCFESHLNSWN